MALGGSGIAHRPFYPPLFALKLESAIPSATGTSKQRKPGSNLSAGREEFAVDFTHPMRTTVGIHGWRRFGLRVLALALVPGVQARPQAQVAYTQPLSTGARLDPVGDFIDLGSMPL